MTLPLARRLREETWPLHTRAERAGLMPALLRGQLPRPAYVRLLQQLLGLYQPLEAALAAHADHPWLAAWPLAALCRADALAEDLQVLAGPGEAVVLAPAPALQALRARIVQLERESPGLLLAHAYVRYLGDLSGGQVLAQRVRAAYDLPPGQGTRFYEFGTAEHTAALQACCRQALASLAPPPADADALVAEACWCFARHVDLFEQLAPAGTVARG